jgi:hypothetical protein
MPELKNKLDEQQARGKNAGAEGMSLAPHLEALALVLDRGWRLFPCAERAKAPLVTDWPRRASSNVEVISRWAEKYQGCNWGLACGPESGIFVVDVDGRRGEDSLRSLVDQHGTWEKTLAARTANGTHLYFRWPNAETIIRNSVSKIGAGIDVRGRRGYVLCPPSIHPSGTPYEWTAANLHTTAAPDWLLEAITSTAVQAVLNPREFGILFEGRRNDGLARYAGKLRRDGIGQREIETKLLAANERRCRPPLENDEVLKIAASVSRYAVGGPDPLEAAWQAIQGEGCASNYEKFLALARRLQQDRPDQPVALPLERIAALLGCDWTQPRAYRKRAVLAGILQRVGEYVPHRLAATYRVTHPLGETLQAHPLDHPLTPTSGLVGGPLVGAPQELPLVGERELPLVGAHREKENGSEFRKPCAREWKTPTFSVLDEAELADKVARSMKTAAHWNEIAGHV